MVARNTIVSGFTLAYIIETHEAELGIFTTEKQDLRAKQCLLNSRDAKTLEPTLKMIFIRRVFHDFFEN